MPRPRRRTPPVLVAAFALAMAATAGSWAAATRGGDATAARAMGPLPACRYDDIMTTPRGYDDWSITLVDTILRVPSTYVPLELVPVSEAGLAGSLRVSAVAIDDLAAMAAAAEAAGAPLAIQSAYRSYTQQKSTFDYWVSVNGYKGALKVSARPGHSEHQLGLAIDVKSADGGPPWEGTDWALSPAGKWMKANAWTYGWLMSYPKGKFDVVCYSYESWHFRYVGRELAAKIHASGLTVREYLWANYTTTTVPATKATSAPVRTPGAAPILTPAVTASPTIAPTLPPTPTPTPVPTPLPTEPPTPAADVAPAIPTGDDAPGLATMAGVFGIGVIALVLVGAGLAGRWSRRRS